MCDTVGAEGIEVRYLNTDGSRWLRGKGRRAVERESLAPMCQRCFVEMENDAVARRAAEVAQRVRADAQSAALAATMNTLRTNGPRYREACAEHEDDLKAAERMAATWDVGNGLFGRRGE